ncbi:MAG: hypothetical protein ABIG61_11760 [Planctomycetota bacterium]
MGAVAGTPGQSRLLASYSAVESFHMRGIDLLTNAQLLNTLFDISLFAKQCFGRYFQQIASVVSNLFYNSRLQIRKRFETGMLESASAVFATAMLYIPKYLQVSQLSKLLPPPAWRVIPAQEQFSPREAE